MQQALNEKPHKKPPIANMLQVENAPMRAPEQLHAQLVNMLHTIVFAQHPQSRHYIEKIYAAIANPGATQALWLLTGQVKKAGFNELVVKVMSLHPVLLNLAIQAAITASKQADCIPINRTPTGTVTRKNIQLRLGLYAKETEPGSEQLIRAMAGIAVALEHSAPFAELKSAVQALWLAANADEGLDEVTMQIFYADQIYHNFPAFVHKVQSQFTSDYLSDVDLGQWLNCYTWLGTDRDGRPHDTNLKTRKFIQRLEQAIRDNYHAELCSIQTTFDNDLSSIISKLDQQNDLGYTTAQQLVDDLNALPTPSADIDMLILKVKTFGFYYLQLEFRDNAHMQEEVIDSLLQQTHIQSILGKHVDASYRHLTRQQKITLLSYLLDAEHADETAQIKPSYLARNEASYAEKSQRYQNRDYIDLLSVDADYIKQVNVDSTLGRFSLMAEYPDSIHVHAIAETQGPEDALAILFLAKVNDGTCAHIDVALQPEDASGAVTIMRMISYLYQNPIYRQHLKSRDSQQYIVFGPSDTGKQGGKAMHLANQNIAQLHALIAKQFKLRSIIHVIIGYEHARCNGPLLETLEGYGALQQSHNQYMLAGLNEMRSHLLAPQQSVDFLYQLFTAQINYQPQPTAAIPQVKARAEFWLDIVKDYQQWFHNHAMLPKLLRRIARFDIINATAKGTRPPSRILNTRNLEAHPSAIRAIPWARAFLLSGIHCEIIGAGQLKQFSTAYLHAQYQQEPDFARYIRHIAYGVARCDLDFAWLIFGEQRPQAAEIQELAAEFKCEAKSSRQMLAWIDHETSCVMQVVYQALYGKPCNEHYIEPRRLLHKFNPALAREVQWRAQYFEFFKVLLKDSHVNKEVLKATYIKDLFSGSLNISNTAISMFEPQYSNVINWD